MPEDNGKKNEIESYGRNLQSYGRHVACSYCYRLLCTNDSFSKPFKSYLGENAVSNLSNSMVEEHKKYCDMMKKHFNNKLVMTTKDDEDFNNPPKCWICGVFYANYNFQVRDHCHVTGKYRGSAQIYKLNYKILVAIKIVCSF